MKIAVTGKGGVGKSTIAAALAKLMAERGRKVLGVDADPDANLAAALGISAEDQETIIPISKQVALIEERTGAKVNQYGQVFKINPMVSDIADNYAYTHDGVALLVLGAVQQGGGGCACPENVLIRALITDLVLYKDEALVLDMEAGIEHLGRATTRGVDTMVVVIEPGQRAVDAARRILKLAGDIGLKDCRFIANKVTGADDEAFLREALPDADFLGFIPYSEEIRLADRSGLSVLGSASPETVTCFRDILNKLEEAQND